MFLTIGLSSKDQYASDIQWDSSSRDGNVIDPILCISLIMYSSSQAAQMRVLNGLL